MAINRARQTGSAFTAWTFVSAGLNANTAKSMILCQEVSHRAPQPIAPAVEVHPLNYIRPTEIVVPRAVSHGEITLTIMEAFNKNSIFEQIGLTYGVTINDLGDLFNWMMTNSAALNPDSPGGSQLSLIRVIRDVGGSGFRARQFEGARIVDVRDDETTRVDSTLNPLQVTVWYTKLTPLNYSETPVPESTATGVPDALWGTNY